MGMNNDGEGRDDGGGVARRLLLCGLVLLPVLLIEEQGIIGLFPCADARQARLSREGERAREVGGGGVVDTMAL